MLQLSPALSSTIAGRHGVVRSEELIDSGVTRSAIRIAIGRGSLITVHRGVYRLATAPDTFHAQCVAACLADPTSFVSGIAAGRLWSFRHVYPTETPIAVVGHDRNPFSRHVIIRRSNNVEPFDWVERPDGIRVASPPRAWFDCARDLGDERFEALTEWVLDHHCTLPTLWHLARRLTARGRPGSARVRRITSQRSDWQRPAGSKLEIRVLKALEARGVGPLVRQHRIELPNGIVIHADGADPTIRWAVEIDHVTWHGGRLDAQADKGRDRQLRRINWQVDRITDQECRDDFDRSIDELVDLYHLRRGEQPAA